MGRTDRAAAMSASGPFGPVRVSSETLPRSRRACMRYPSYLISCSHSGPFGGASTSLQSCGLIHFGRLGDWPRGLLFIKFVITCCAGSVGIYTGGPSKCDHQGTANLPEKG